MVAWWIALFIHFGAWAILGRASAFRGVDFLNPPSSLPAPAAPLSGAEDLLSPSPITLLPFFFVVTFFCIGAVSERRDYIVLRQDLNALTDLAQIWIAFLDAKADEPKGCRYTGGASGEPKNPGSRLRGCREGWARAFLMTTDES